MPSSPTPDPATPSRAERISNNWSPTPPKRVSSLIQERHEWIAEFNELRKRQSISEADFMKMKEEQKKKRNSTFMLTPTPSDDLQWMLGNQRLSSNHSLDISMDSLDRESREYLGDARRLSFKWHQQQDVQDSEQNNGNSNKNSNGSWMPQLIRYSSDVTEPRDNRHSSAANNNSMKGCATGKSPLAYLQVADSEFWGFATSGITESHQVTDFVSQIRTWHPEATHIPYAWNLPSHNLEVPLDMDDDGSDRTPPQAGSSPSGYDEDGEPEGSTGPFLLEQVQNSRHFETDGVWLFPEEASGGISFDPQSGTLVVVVRYFGSQLLGVTCGRLSQCYQRVAETALHRLFRGCHVPHQLDMTHQQRDPQNSITKKNIYGLAAGDTELHLDILQGEFDDKQIHDSDAFMSTLLQELDFDGFRGAEGEVLPRLQNLQADFYRFDADAQGPVVVPPVEGEGSIIPVYRYPGNYQGDEWETFPWSFSSLKIKHAVETSLPHFYHAPKNEKQQQEQQPERQTMNHCVTNYYRDARDFIAHHSDKDLDLDKTAAIVSVSIGAERVLELRRRAEPRDLTRILLPHGSMLLLGPVTNQYFTHSILPVVDDPLLGPPTIARPPTNRNHDPHARISLTLRHVTTYMDTQSRRLFGEGVECNKTLLDLKRNQRREVLSFILGFGGCWRSFWVYAMRHYNLPPIVPMLLPWSTSTISKKSSASSGSGKDNRDNRTVALQEGAIFFGSAAVAWWSFCGLRRIYHKRKEERVAREFFTKKSTSGTKY